jgi:galactan endo-1,6-beta-galactosidase
MVRVIHFALVLIVVASVLTFGARCLTAPTSSPSEHSVIVDPSRVWANWHGWGSSLSWWAHATGDTGNANLYADLIYGTNEVSINGEKYPGLGFNIVRYNVGGGGINQPLELKPPRNPWFRDIHGFWTEAPTPQKKSGTWDWTLDQNQRAIMQLARLRGANLFELFSNAPMWWMNMNRSSAGSETGADCLAPDHYDDFAFYLATVAQHAKTDWNIQFASVEAFNEPAAPWWKFPATQEGCHFDASTQRTIIAKLRRALDAAGLPSVKVAASDENSADDGLRTWNAFDSNTQELIGRLNVHGYFSGTHPYRGTNMPPLRDAAGSSKPLWMSEYGDNDASGATLAQTIVYDLHGLHPNAWVYWQPVEPNRSGWGLVNADYVNAGDRPAPAVSTPLVQVNRKFFVFGQFTRYIRPGFRVIEINDAASIAAFDPKASKLVIVVQNGASPVRVSYDLSRFKRLGSTYMRIATSTASSEGSPDLKLTIDGPWKIDELEKKTFSTVLYPNAVETFVIEAYE